MKSLDNMIPSSEISDEKKLGNLKEELSNSTGVTFQKKVENYFKELGFSTDEIKNYGQKSGVQDLDVKMENKILVLECEAPIHSDKTRISKLRQVNDYVLNQEKNYEEVMGVLFSNVDFTSDLKERNQSDYGFVLVNLNSAIKLLSKHYHFCFSKEEIFKIFRNSEGEFLSPQINYEYFENRWKVDQETIIYSIICAFEPITNGLTKEQILSVLKIDNILDRFSKRRLERSRNELSDTLSRLKKKGAVRSEDNFYRCSGDFSSLDNEIPYYSSLMTKIRNNIYTELKDNLKFEKSPQNLQSSFNP